METKDNLRCKLSDIHTYFPTKILDNEYLATIYEGWTAEKIFEKTGIKKRHIVETDQYVSDLAVKAAEKLFAEKTASRDEIDAIILCTMTPDYAFPCTAALIHQQLGLPTHCMTFDFNHGCTGFIYGLSLAGSLVHSGQIKKALLITAETFSRWCHPQDKSVTTIFGDGAAAVCVEADHQGQGIGPFLFGSDGRGFKQLFAPVSAAHAMDIEISSLEPVMDKSGNIRTAANLYMNGPELFRFAITSVPKLVNNLLQTAGKNMTDIDAFVFHQANAFMLQNIQKKLKIPDEKMIYALEDVGNTVSATIPIAIQRAYQNGAIKKDDTLLLVGFGLGYSWGGCFLTWNP
jgi:3-oxoacyl-[acyl-carrier-protein] synthase-3